MKHGIGTLTMSNGIVYEGEWEDNKIHGKGKKTYPNGDHQDGHFNNGRFTGFGKLKNNF